MNVEIGAEAVQFPEKKYINGIVFAVYNSILEIFEILRMFPYLLATLPRVLPQKNLCRASLFTCQCAGYYNTRKWLRALAQGNSNVAMCTGAGYQQRGYVHWCGLAATWLCALVRVSGNMAMCTNAE